MALKVAEVLIRWRGEGSQQVEADTKRMGSALTDLGSKAKAAGAVMSAGLTAPLVLIGKQAIDAASDLNEAMSAVETVFGSTADQVVNFSRTAASQLGQSRQAALSSAAAMGALFKGVGLTEQQMADFSGSLLQASADLGSFYNVDPGMVLENLRSGLVGEAEPLRKFGILLTEDAVKAKGLELGLADANGELSEGAKVRARYALITEQLGAAEGDFMRTSDGLANSQRILAARMQDIRAEIGSYLLPYALKASAAFSSLLDRFEGLSDQAKGLGVALGAVAAAAGPVLVIAGQLISSVGSLAPLFGALTGPLGLVAAGVVALGLAFKNNWFGIRDLVTQVVERIGDTIGRMVQFFQSAKQRGLDPFRLALRTLIVTLGEKLGRDHPFVEFLQQVLRLGERLKTAFDTQGFSGVVDELLRTAGRLSNWGSEQLANAKTFAATFVSNLVTGFQGVNWDLIGNSIREGLTKGADWFGDVLGKALAFAGSLVQNIVQGFQGINWDLVGGTIMGGLQSALTALSELGGWILDRLKEVDWQGVARSAGDLAKFIGVMINTGVRLGVLALMDLGGWILEQLNKVNWAGIASTLQTKGQEISTGLLSGIQEKGELIFTWFNALGQKIQVMIGEASGWLLQKGRDIIQGLLDGIIAIFVNVSTFFNNLGTSIINALPKDFGSLLTDTGSALIQGLWDGAQAKWTEFTDWLGGLTVTLPGIGGAEKGKPPKDNQNGGGRGDFRAMGGPLGKRLTLVGEYGPELLINRSLVMPHGAAQSRIAAMGGMAYGGTGSWGAWLAAQDAATRARVRSMRAAGQLDAITRRELMGGGRIAEDGSHVGAGYYNRADQRWIRESGRRNRQLDRINQRADLQHSRNSDALNRANAYGDRTGDYSRADRVMAREARNGGLQSGGLSRQEKQYLINNYGTITVQAKDANVARAIGDQLSSRDR